MELWSKGLGTRVVRIDISKLKPYSLEEVLEDLPKVVRDNIEKEVSGRKVIVLKGGKVEPVNWEFVIIVDWSDVKGMFRNVFLNILKKKLKREI